MDGSFFSIFSFSSENTVNIALLLYDAASDKPHLKFREEHHSLEWTDEGDMEVLSYLADLSTKAWEMGPLALVEYLEENCSNAIRISKRVPLSSILGEPVAVIDSLFELHVLGPSAPALN